MAHNHRPGIAAMQLFEECTQGDSLRWCARVGRLSPDIESTLIAHADGVLVVVQAVGAYQPFRSSWLNLSVTTDHVMVTDTELIMPVFAVPGVYLSRRALLVGRHCRTMEYYQGY